MSAVQWKWRRKSDGEPLTRLVTEHYLTREAIVELLCAGSVETGTRLSQAATLAAVRGTLADAWLEEDTLLMWADTRGGSDAEVKARYEWARELVARL